ncbi:WD repeat protein [Ceratobasidium sp. AG-Ba]|nr:WD repeat protein [Ceratobasidium sp. AG-Ba]
MARGSEAYEAMTPPSSSETSHSYSDDGTKNGEESETEETQPQKLFSEKRHYTCGNPRTPDGSVGLPPWRLKDKLRTARAALVVCLNIGVDPPDVVKTQPCATLECWVDPFSMPSNKALEAIGRNLQHQFENLNPRMNYKPYLDPSVEDTRKWCIGLRKMVGRECALFYYNGHGVPKPTRSGEIWVFNRGYSQYIPVSIQDLQLWLGSPCVFVWDCSAAGNIVTNFLKFAEQKDQQARMNQQQHPDAHAQRPFMDCIQLAACAADEVLPMTPELPADVFTACLTSPIEMALRFFALRNPLPSAASNIRKGTPHLDNVMQLPGDLKDRRTPLGELNWIFTAVTDTIAWTTFPRDIFRRLFRQDLMVAALFRNFLLAERIMRNYHCTPQSYPPLPPSHNHPLWNSWDLAVDSCLAQLPQLRIAEEQRLAAQQEAINGAGSQISEGPGPYQYMPSSFFGDHLTAFQVWLTRGAALSKTSATGDKVQPIYFNADSSDESDAATRARSANEEGFSPRRGILIPRRPPDQLPIILQVLLSQTHRLRALILLSQFMDLGPWAVHLALAIGIFPYVQKLLQSPAQELKPVLVFVWARLLAVDRSCREDLLRDDGYMYFVNILSPHTGVYIPNSAEHRAMCAFILSVIARDHPEGQMACLRQSVFHMCLIRLDDPDYLLRQWSALCIAQLWDGNDEAKKYGIDQGAQDKLSVMMSDHSPPVRAAAMYALAVFLGASGSAIEGRKGGGGTGCRIPLQERDQLRLEVAIATGATLAGKEDASPMVRKELVVLLSCLVHEWRGWFVVAAWVYWEDHGGLGPLANPTTREQRASEGSLRAAHAQREWAERSGGDDRRKEEMRVVLSSFFTIYCTLLELSVDPYPEVGTIAQTVVDYIMACLLESPFSKLPSSDFPKSVPPRMTHYPHQPKAGAAFDEKNPALSRVDTASSHISNTLRRTTSFAATLRNIATGYAFPTSLDSPGAGPSSSHDDGSAGGKRDVPKPHLVSVQYQSPYSSTATSNSVPATPKTSTSMSVPSSPRYTKSLSSSPTKETHLGQSRFTTDPRSYSHGQSVSAADVIEALVEEDNERLRARRTRHHPQGPRSSDGTESSATGTTTTSVLSLNTGEGLADVLPLKSKYFDWSCEYFLEPQMRQSEEDEPGSVTYNELMWRRQRNEKILYSTDHQANVAPHCPWDRPVSSFTVDGPPVRMKLHQFDPHIAVIDGSTSLSVWDWSKKKKIVSFNNGNPAGSAITGVHFINEDAQTMLLTASAEGTVRIFRNYDVQRSHDPMEIVTSWRALNHTIPLQKGSGLVCDWQQESGLLACGGDSRVIRVWDGFQELCLAEVFTQMDTCVTSIAFDPDGPNAFLASSADGRLCLYDRRIGGHASMVRNWHRHQAWIESVHWQTGGMKSIMTASVDGEVRLWDLRDRDGVGLSGKKWQPHGNALANFAMHPKAGVFASTSAITSAARPQTIIVHSLPPIDRPSVLSRFTVPVAQTHSHHFTARSPFFSGPSSLAFHPNEMLYAMGGPDGVVRMFGCKLKESQEEDVPRDAGAYRTGVGMNGHHHTDGVRLASVRSAASSG